MRTLCIFLMLTALTAYSVDREEQRRLSDYLKILRESAPDSAVPGAIFKQIQSFENPNLKIMAAQGIQKEFLYRGTQLIHLCRKEAYGIIKNSSMEKVDLIKEKLAFLRGLQELTEEKLEEVNKANVELEEIFVPEKIEWSDEVKANRKFFEELKACMEKLGGESSVADFAALEYIAKVSACPLLLKDKTSQANFGRLTSTPFEVSLAVSQINLIRTFSGKETLLIDPRLNLLALSHSKDMKENNFFGHESPTEGMKTLKERAAKFKTAAEDEILGRGTDDVLRLNRAYLKRLKNAGVYYSGWSRIGVGYFEKHWTEVFGK